MKGLLGEEQKGSGDSLGKSFVMVEKEANGSQEDFVLIGKEPEQVIKRNVNPHPAAVAQSPDLTKQTQLFLLC